MIQPIIFTDLDGTLLDYPAYSFEKAKPALEMLKRKDIPLILCSSKTKQEIEFYRNKLNNHHPFISENGGGIFIPEDYFGFKIEDIGFKTEKVDHYYLIRLGTLYIRLRKAIVKLRQKGFPVKGFGDMTIKEIANATSLSEEEAAMSKERDFDEPFFFEGNKDEIGRLSASVQSMGFGIARGRYFHILGDNDKGRAVAILIDLYKKLFGQIITIAVGDSPNDLPMLEQVEYPVIVQKPDGTYNSDMNVHNLIKADGIGPEGWNRIILKLIKENIYSPVA